MAREIAAPLPVRAGGRAGDDASQERAAVGRQLDALEVPDCGCAQGRLCLAGSPGRPDRCPGQGRCRECPPAMLRPCEHVLPLLDAFPTREAAEAGGEAMAVLQRAYDPDGYADRPPPPPEAATTRAARVAILAKRARRGYGLFSPADVLDMDRCGERAEAGRGTGEVVP